MVTLLPGWSLRGVVAALQALRVSEGLEMRVLSGMRETDSLKNPSQILGGGSRSGYG